LVLGNNAEVYIASADWMTRNTIRRVEVGAPIYDNDIKARILSMFRIMMQDNVKARIQQPDGSYKKQTASSSPLNAQEYFYTQAYAAAKAMTATEEIK